MQSKDYTSTYPQHSAVCSIHSDTHLVATVHHPGNSGSQITHFKWKQNSKLFFHSLFYKADFETDSITIFDKGKPLGVCDSSIGKTFETILPSAVLCYKDSQKLTTI